MNLIKKAPTVKEELIKTIVRLKLAEDSQTPEDVIADFLISCLMSYNYAVVKSKMPGAA